MAHQGLYEVTRNNPRVGCLLVKDGSIIARGYHREDGGDHAEINALKHAGANAKGSTAYVSLEPCCFHGRTPPCTQALIAAGIHRVVIAEKDSNPQVNGNGIEQLRSAGIEVSTFAVEGVSDLNPGFHKRVTLQRPYVRVKSGMSLDGRVAMSSGQSQWITGGEARSDVQRLRGRSSAIVTGIGTVLSDNPRLDVRDPRFRGSPLIRVVFDTHGQFPSDAAMLNTEGSIVLVCNSDVEPREGVERWSHSQNRAPIEDVLEKMASIGFNEVLVEAGPRLTGSFLKSGLWDELVLYVAPKFLGSTAKSVADLRLDRLGDAIVGKIKSIDSLGADVRVVLVKDE